MKIGILTLPLNSNYGGILQAYALQTVLERMGHEVNVIYKNPYMKEPSLFEYLCRCYQKYVIGKDIFIKREKWKNTISPILRRYTDTFIKKYIHLFTIDNLKQITENDFEAIIVGSDQIWRRKYFVDSWGGDETDAFLKFTEGWNILRLVYAASFGTDHWEFSTNRFSEIKSLVHNFSAISVREQSGVNICRDYLQVEAVHSLDPTMLLSVKDYSLLMGDSFSPSPNSGNMFCYILNNCKEKQDIIRRVASSKKLTPYEIYFPTDQSSANKVWPIPPVERFLRGVWEAQFVVTDSFHGCVFSIIFGKPFIVIANEERGATRMESLVKLFHLDSHLIKSLSEFNSEDSYETGAEVVRILERRKQEAFVYLNSYIQCK